MRHQHLPPTSSRSVSSELLTIVFDKFSRISFSFFRQQFSDDEEDAKRVVRSAKAKRYEALNGIIKNIRNSKKIKDFNQMETLFLELTKAYDKARPVVAKEENGVTPRFFVRILVEMEDMLNETWEDKAYRKSMSKTNGKSLGSLRSAN